MLGFLLRHCAEVASHMFSLAVIAHASFTTPHKDGKSPVCELEMLAVSIYTLGRNGDSRVCQRMRRMLGRDTLEPFHAGTEGTGIGSSCVVALMCEMQLFLGYAWDSIWSHIHGGMSLAWNEHTSSVFGAPLGLVAHTSWPHRIAQSCFDRMGCTLVVFALLERGFCTASTFSIVSILTTESNNCCLHEPQVAC